MHAPEGRDPGLGRIGAFSDGIFAFAITLLVLELKVPQIGRDDVAAELVRALGAELPSLKSYLVSFFVIGNFWLVHHSLFEQLRRFFRVVLHQRLLAGGEELLRIRGLDVRAEE